MRRFYSFPWNSVKSALFRLRKNPQRLEPLRGRISGTMIAGGKLSLSHTVAGQPAVRVRLPVPIASVWLPAEFSQPGAFVCAGYL